LDLSALDFLGELLCWRLSPRSNIGDVCETGFLFVIFRAHLNILVSYRATWLYNVRFSDTGLGWSVH